MPGNSGEARREPGLSGCGVAILGVERQRPAWTERPCRDRNAEGANAGRNVVADLEEEEEEIRQRVRPAASRRIAILVAAPFANVDRL